MSKEKEVLGNIPSVSGWRWLRSCAVRKGDKLASASNWKLIGRHIYCEEVLGYILFWRVLWDCIAKWSRHAFRDHCKFVFVLDFITALVYWGLSYIFIYSFYNTFVQYTNPYSRIGITTMDTIQFWTTWWASLECSILQNERHLNRRHANGHYTNGYYPKGFYPRRHYVNGSCENVHQDFQTKFQTNICKCRHEMKQSGLKPGPLKSRTINLCRTRFQHISAPAILILNSRARTSDKR